ncbi:TNT domain-containing protein [Rhodoferax koreensis]|uniref:TNT domain-containing protein n=1 Tax=Rhodoferax koreensis TaxID=1842727 RepID=UPI0012FF824D|nr:TNT domain-containing protein [Rhodoferax koreense]
MISSTQGAVDAGVNRFETGGTLVSTDLQNSASYQGSGYSVSTSLSMNAAGTTTPGGSAGIGQTEGAAASTTSAGISGMAGNTAVRTGDAQTGLKQIFDTDNVSTEVNAQIAITATFGSQASKAIGDYADSQMQQAQALREQARQESDPGQQAALVQQAQNLESQWGDQGTSRLVAHTLVGALTGGLGGTAAAAAGTLTAPAVASALQSAGIEGPLAQVLTAAASTAVGAAAGGTAGAVAAGNEVVNNYLGHDDIRKRAQQLEGCRAKGDAQCEIDTLKYYDLKSAQNTGNIDYNSVLTQGALASERDQLTQLLNDPTLSAADKAQAQRSINELNTAIGVIQKAPVLKNAAEVSLIALDVATLGELVAAKTLSSVVVKELVATDVAAAGTRSGIPTAYSVSKIDLNASGDDAMQYVQYQSGKGWIWPENLGFVGAKTEKTLPVGTKLDRVGGPTGSFLAPSGTSYEARGLAPGSGASNVYQYEVMQPLPVVQGEIAPAFGQSGGGIQILPNVGVKANVQWLLDNGYIGRTK